MGEGVTSTLLAILLASQVVLGQIPQEAPSPSNTQGAVPFNFREAEVTPEEYCPGRSVDEFFRKRVDPNNQIEVRKECGKYYRCVPSTNGGRAIVQNACQPSMAFDVDIQICQHRRKVTNCNRYEKEKLPLPYWPIPLGEPTGCSGVDEIKCGSGECLPRASYCNGVPDCTDGSDENVCAPGVDPNGAPICDSVSCTAEVNCHCSVDGTRIPKNLTPEQTPQMIVITFTGAVNKRNAEIFDRIFHGRVRHKTNECTPKATFFVSHAFTNYSAVQELHRRGHEIATNSITNDESSEYWSTLDADTYAQEFYGNRIIIEEFANLTNSEVSGMRVPKLRSGGNEQFQMMIDYGFTYDSSIAAPKTRLPIWPYNLKYRMPHKCIGTDQNCPSQSFDVYEMVLNELDRRDDPKFDEELTGCHIVDSCANIIDEKQFMRFLDNNLARHYSTNRAPLGLHFTAAYFEQRPKFQQVFVDWVSRIAAHGNYFFVTNQQVIDWINSPTELAAIANFQEWKHRCDPQGLPLCSLPNPCASRVPRLFPNEDSMYLYTCMQCPVTYPWLFDPLGEGQLDI